MIKKIENFLIKKIVDFSCLKSKKLWSALLMSFFLLAAILPFTISAQDPEGLLGHQMADWGSCNAWNPTTWINCIFIGIIKVLGFMIFGIPLLIGMFLLWIMTVILGWVLSPSFVSVSFTNNDFVNKGLGITREFANYGFLIFLIVIALATALRIEEYKARKTLPILIIIGLLVNFSPVFCGFIIDISNMVMAKLTQPITGLSGVQKAGEAAALAASDLAWSGWNSIGLAALTFIQAGLVAVFLIFAAFIYAVYALLFTTRYVMLWILVIISPIAFVSYILPATRRGKTLLNWSEWWHQFVQWCIIGIIGAFFIYLAIVMIGEVRNAALVRAPTRAETVKITGDVWKGARTFMDQALPMLIPLILLFIAYKELKKTSAMFARGIISGAEQVSKAATGAAMTIATMGAGAAIGATAGVAGRLGTAMGKVGTYAKNLDDAGKRRGGITGTLAQGIAKPAVWATKGATGIKGWAGRRKEEAETFVEKHKRVKKGVEYTKKLGGYTKKAAIGLKESLWGKTVMEIKEKPGRRLTPEELETEHRKVRRLTKAEMERAEILDKAGKRVRKLEPPELLIGFKLKRLSPKEMAVGRVILKEKVKKKEIEGAVKAGLTEAIKQIQKPVPFLGKLKKEKKPKMTEETREKLKEAGIEEPEEDVKFEEEE